MQLGWPGIALAAMRRGRAARACVTALPLAQANSALDCLRRRDVKATLMLVNRTTQPREPKKG